MRYDKESAYIAICDYNRCDGKARIIVDNETGVFWADENIVAETADKMALGLQYHPESILTPAGPTMLTRCIDQLLANSITGETN